MSSSKYSDSKFYSSRVPSVISAFTSIVPFIVVGLSLSINPWFIIAYSVFAAIPIGAISIVAGLIGLKTKLYRLAIASLIINLMIIVNMVAYVLIMRIVY